MAFYEFPCHPLATPIPLTPSDAYQTAKGDYEHWLASVGGFTRRAAYALAGYAISTDDLDALAASVELLRGIVDQLCLARLDMLQRAASS